MPVLLYAGGGDDSPVVNMKIHAKKGTGLLGVSAGFTIGSGFSAKYFLTDKFAVQTTLYGPRVNVNAYGDYDYVYNLCCPKKVYDIMIGGSMYYYINKDKGLFLYWGGVYRDGKTVYMYREWTEYGYQSTDYTVTFIKTSFNTGIGLGTSVDIGDYANIELMGGYAFYFKNAQLDNLFFTVEASLLFYIK